MAMARAVVATACVDADDRAATTTLTAHDAIDIYLAKASCSARDGSTSVLSKRYNITMKAVRDVWNLRTWAWTTMPYWTRSDLAKFLRKHLCTQCQRKGVTSLASACKDCAKPRRRGRPCLRSVFCASLRSDTADPSLATRTNAHGQQSMQTSLQTRPSPWHDRATIAYPVTHHSVPTVQVSHEDDVDNWLRQADLQSLPVLHADCISNDEAVWKYEDPFASNVMPMMPPPQEYVVFADADSSVPASAHMLPYDAHLARGDMLAAASAPVGWGWGQPWSVEDRRRSAFRGGCAQGCNE